MNINNISLASAFFVIAAASSSAQLVTYTFGSTATPVVTANQVADNLAASAFSGLNGSPSTGGTSPLSSGSYFTATTWGDAYPGTNYFTFTLTPEAGYQFSTTSLSFNYRATGSGPAALAIYSSANSYASPLASFASVHDSAWYASGFLSVSLTNLTTSTSFRIYGSGAESNSGTLRVDNVILNGTVSAVPEPSTYALLGGVGVLGFTAYRRLRLRHVDLHHRVAG
jgi:hypothetical protein